MEDMLTVPFDYLHQWTGLPWWGTLVGVGFVLRLFLAPLQVRQLRHSLESSKLLLTLDKIQKESIPVEPQDLDKARYRMLDLAKMNFRSIFKITFFQMAAFFGVLRLSHVEPLKTQLKTGGYSWFTDLTAVDPTYRLALGASLLIMCTIYWPFIASRRPPTRLIATLALILPVIGIAVSTQFPASWLVYMCGTALYSFVAAVVLSVPSVRKRLDLPPHFVEPDLSLFKSVSQAQVDMKEIKNETPKTP
uniref:Membrane insertase YidC/Oxa/ALB C-terminal domain-containing protein n=1 Tax=Arcella intermedia TaxID=1963864 RepID=A0A6B2LFA2_9EUKA